MNATSELGLLESIRTSVKPVIFKTGVRSAPISIAGTAFLAGYREHIFLITARHVASAQAAENLVVYPSRRMKTPMRFSDAWDVGPQSDESDLTDIAAFRVKLKYIPKRDRQHGTLINLNKPEATNWIPHRDSSLYFAIGYPTECNSVNYALNQVEMTQILLSGRYIGPSNAIPGCFTINFKNPLCLESISGFSGAPVFNLRSATSDETTIPRFCGVVLRGGVTAQVLHFLPANIVMSYVTQATQFITINKRGLQPSNQGESK